MQGLIIHCLLLFSILGICLVPQMSLDCQFFEGKYSALYALAACTENIKFSVFSPLAILSHPIVSINHLYLGLHPNVLFPALTSRYLLLPLSLYYVPTTLGFFFLLCEHIKLFSMLEILFFLKSSSPDLYKDRSFSSIEASAQVLS